MLTRIRILTAVLFLPILLVSQEIGLKDSQWLFNFDGRAGVSKLNYQKDTLLEDKIFNVFYLEAEWKWPNKDSMILRQNDMVLLSNQDGIIYFKFWANSIIDNDIDTLYNFNAGKGFTWSYGDTGDDYDITVIDTFRTMIKNQSLYTMVYDIVNRGGNWTHRDTFIERIGNKHSFIVPYDLHNGSVDSNIAGHPLCYYDNLLGHVIPDNRGYYDFYNIPYTFWDYACMEDLTTTEDRVQEETFKLYPNPVTERLYLPDIDDQRQEKASVVIYNMEGRLILKDAMPNHAYQGIDVSVLDAGLYIVKIANRSSRFIKM